MAAILNFSILTMFPFFDSVDPVLIRFSMLQTPYMQIFMLSSGSAHLFDISTQLYIKKLQIIQNKAIRIAYKLDPLSHTEDIHKIAKIDLIKDRFQILTYKFIDSLKEHSDLFKLQNELRASRIKRGHKTHLDKLISEYAEIYDEN